MHPVDILPFAFAAIVFGVLVLNLGYGYLRAKFLNWALPDSPNTFLRGGTWGSWVRAWLGWYLTSVTYPSYDLEK